MKFISFTSDIPTRKLSEYSKLKDVVMSRTVNGQHLAALYGLNAIRHVAYADLDVYANDVITVSENPVRRFFKDFLTTLSFVSGPLVISINRLTN